MLSSWPSATSGSSTSSTLVLGPGHDRAHRRDRRRQDDAWSRPSSCSSAAGPTPALVRPGADEAVVEGRFVRRRRRGRARPGRARRRAGRAPTSTAAWPRVGALAEPGAGSSTSTASTPTSRCCRRRCSAPRSTASAASTSSRCARRRAASCAAIDAELARARRRRAGPGPRDRPAALPGRRARRRRRSTIPTRTTRLDAEEDRARRRRWPTARRRAARRRRARRRRRRRSTRVGDALAALDGRAPFADAGRAAARGGRRAGRRRRRAAVGGRGASSEDPERLAAVRERRQLLRDLRRKYGDDAGRGRSPTATRPRAAWPSSRTTTAGPPSSTRERAEARAAGRGGRGPGRRRAPRPRRPTWPRRSRRTCASWRCPRPASRWRSADDDPGDDVAFLLAANPGAPPLPLAKVASGGELARAMLALRLVLDARRPPDAGVRRGRRRHRRRRGDRGRAGRWPRSAPTTRCWSSPTSPRSRPSPTPRSR